MTKPDFDAIRKSTNLVSYFRSKGYSPKKVGQQLYRIDPCPVPACSHNGCFTVDESLGRWRCYSAAHPAPAFGDAVSFERVAEGVTSMEAIERVTGDNVVGKLALIHESEEQQHTVRSPELWSVVKNHDALMADSDALSWLTDTRLIDGTVVSQFQLGIWRTETATLYAFPYFDKDGALATLKYRSADKTVMRMHRGGRLCLFNERALKGATEVLLVEGELDCMAAYVLGIGESLPIVSVPSGASARLRDDTLAVLGGLSRILICFDSDDAGRAGAQSVADQIGPSRCSIVELCDGVKDLNQALIEDYSRADIERSIKRARPCDPILQAIDAIPRSDNFAATRVSDEVIPLLAEVDDPVRVEDYLARVRQRLSLKLKPMKALRAKLEELRPQVQEDDEAGSDAYVMTENEHAEAMELLKNPNILDVIHKDLTEACGIVGEAHLKLGLYLVMMSARISKDPISATVFGASSEGKSYLINQCAEACPPEWVLRLTSASTRSIEYASEDLLSRKVIIIGEMEGIADDALLSVIRQAQTENRLSRLVAQCDAEGGGPRVIRISLEIMSAWIISTTNEGWHDENMTRNVCIFVSSNHQQTKDVLEFTQNAETLEWRRGAAERERRVNRLRNMQRLLRPIAVVFPPWVKKLKFPNTSARHRRDVARFLTGIKLCASIRQHQKCIETDEVSGLEFLTVSLADYRSGHAIMLPLLVDSLSDLSERCKRVLRVCVELSNDSEHSAEDFSVRELQAKAEALELDLSNSHDVRKQARSLTQDDYLAISVGENQVGGGKAKRWKLTSTNLSVSESGELLGLDNAQLGITTPDELSRMLETDGA